MADVLEKSEKKVYERGTVILTEKPFVYILNGSLHLERCDYCFNKCSLLKCSGCSYAHYCGRECQKRGWVFHKTECQNIKNVAPKTVPDSVRYLARVIFRLKKYGIHGDSVGLGEKPRTFYHLMSHYNEIMNDPGRMKIFHAYEKVLQMYLGESAYVLPDTDDLLEIFGRVTINTFAILDENLNNIGSGLYLEASIFDHSCIPNAVHVFFGTTISIRTAVSLESIKFSDIFISYKDTLDLPTKRRAVLKELYYFLCQCERCNDIEELLDMTCIICPNESCGSAIRGGLAVVAPTCPNCKLEVSKEKLEEIKEIVAFTEEKLEKMEKIAYLDICKVCLSKQEGLLHPMSIYTVKILSMAFDSCIGLEKWEDAFMYGTRALDYLRKYYGEKNITFGLFVLKLGKIAGLLNKLDYERKFVYEGVDILLPAFGNNHPIIVNEVLPIIPRD